MALTPYRDILAEAKWVLQNITLVHWDGIDFEKKFGARSVDEIIKSGKTSYLNPCLDQTMVFIHRLNSRGYQPKLVVEERISQRTQQATLHFAVEIPVKINEKIEPITVDFVSGREVRYYKGNYDPTKSVAGRTSLRVHRFPAQHVTARTTLNRFLGILGTKTLYKRFPNVTPQAAHAVFAKMQEMHSPALFNRITQSPPRRRRMK